MPDRIRSGSQLTLLPSRAVEEGWYRTKGVFAGPYLKSLIRTDVFPTEGEITEVHARVHRLWVDNYDGLIAQNEAYVRTKFIEPVLRELGWFFIPEQNLPKGPTAMTRKRPDYCLFSDEESEQRAAEHKDPTAIFYASTSVLEAKRPTAFLDQLEKSEGNVYPSQQIQDYMRHAIDAAGRGFFDWAVLTNGSEWRLYTRYAPPDAYFAFHLAFDREFCAVADFRLFFALFRPDAFRRLEAGESYLDEVRAQSLTKQVELESNLRRRIFDVLEEVAEGYYSNPVNGLGEDDLPKVYEISLIFLYRLLFILYAESRGMLPAKTRGYSSNIRYRKEFSIARLVDELRNSDAHPDDAFDGLYLELKKLFHLINGTNKTLNEKLGVTRYNGGLFTPTEHQEIETWWIGEKHLANILRQLIFAQPAALPKHRQRVIATSETVDYSTLEVRQLGDIYEALLGGRLAKRAGGGLDLVNERGVNQREGAFYTPDWVVEYLVRETLDDLLNRIEQSEEVQNAMRGRSIERQKDNSFAYAVLNLNIVDPAMGSGHFLVRATEHLARQIFLHPTTKPMTERVVESGSKRRLREEIVHDGRVPVPTGISQEEAEIAYWRRRVVEACIYGVDINPLAVELAKLSLWLTCIAVEEPLNFLDHHLRAGNSLVGASVNELAVSPHVQSAEQSHAFDIEAYLQPPLAAFIKGTAVIERQASTEMEVVKQKEAKWHEVRSRVQPFVNIANTWIAEAASPRLSTYDYRLVALHVIAATTLTNTDLAAAEKLLATHSAKIEATQVALQPFHWELEFPDVFFDEQGVRLSDDVAGFDAVIGNPPYVSTHTSSSEAWRPLLERRAGFLDDLYVHFTFAALRLLRERGRLGYIVSDTFFTLTSKRRLRDELQSISIEVLGQCDPFEATVDAAFIVAEKRPMADASDTLLFIQARHETRTSRPEDQLGRLKANGTFRVLRSIKDVSARHLTEGCLRVHEMPISLYRNAVRRAMFEPTEPALTLYRRFNEPVKELLSDWEDRIDTSLKFATNRREIAAHLRSLRSGDVTLLGLAAEGSQGLATANNARFLGYLEGTREADELVAQRDVWSNRWLLSDQTRDLYLAAVESAGGDAARPTADVAAWEAAVNRMRERFNGKTLGIKKTDLYRIASYENIAEAQDFVFAAGLRKAELVRHWRSTDELFLWRDLLSRQNIPLDDDLTDEQFCDLYTRLLDWLASENARRKKRGTKAEAITQRDLGLRPRESYTSPDDVARTAVVFGGFRGRGFWAPFRKGDAQGNRWLDNEPLYIDWSSESVDYLSKSSEARWQGLEFFFRPGVSWTRGANHVALKAKEMPLGIMDVNAMKVTPVCSDVMDSDVLLAILNSDVFSFYLKKFVAHTWMAQLSDVRTMPLVIPTPPQAERLKRYVSLAKAGKRLEFSASLPGNEMVNVIAAMRDELIRFAPSYLQPDAQARLISSGTRCREVAELSVNWECEKLYGVEGAGPFNEF